MDGSIAVQVTLSLIALPVVGKSVVWFEEGRLARCFSTVTRYQSLQRTHGTLVAKVRPHSGLSVQATWSTGWFCG